MDVNGVMNFLHGLQNSSAQIMIESKLHNPCQGAQWHQKGWTG